MIRVVGVRFKLAGKVYYFDPGELPITPTNKVIVETVRGVEYGEVVVGPKDVPEDEVVQPLKKVIRIGSERDAQIAVENKRKEKEAYAAVLKKIETHNLDMYLVDVEYTFDGSKIIFYFTAEGRVDFRDLVRDLAGMFRTRIEMRQIGVRDEAKLLGGIGPCGRVLCCTSFLGDFAPVSIRMAKDQNLSLNPSKISGLCGRLMCCLRYEQETYELAKKDPTLAPGYVPPVIESELPALRELEDQPAPAIGVRNRSGSGFSARIAQAAAVIEKPESGRRERGPSERSGSGRPDRPQGERPQGERSQGGRPEQGGQRPPRPDRPQGDRPQGGRPEQGSQRPPRPDRPQGDRPQGDRPQGGRPQGGRPEQGSQRPPRPDRPQGDRPQGDRPQGGRPEQSGQRPPRPDRSQGDRPQGERPQGERPQGERPQGERQPRPDQGPRQPAPQAQAAPGEQPGGSERQGGSSRRRRRRPRGGRGERPDGQAGPGPTNSGPSNPGPQ